MEVCYAYDGIGRVIMEMTAADWAAWVGTFGTLGAVWAGFWLYRRTRLDAKSDLLARRRVLHAMLRMHAECSGDVVQTVTCLMHAASTSGDVGLTGHE